MLYQRYLELAKRLHGKHWAVFPVVTNTFIAITQDPTSHTLDSLSMRHLERWTVLMYSTTEMQTR